MGVYEIRGCLFRVLFKKGILLFGGLDWGISLYRGTPSMPQIE